MPIYNRIRIINIQYDHREIEDTVFDFFDGYNALLNLSNGSGKTVIVETLFQPVLPNMSIGKWKIADYLTGDQRPTFVMIEWRLDQTKTPTYFMTGICMSLTRTEDDDGRPRKSLKYFTFTHTYTKGNEFDIANIPILSENGQRRQYLTYDEALTMFKKYDASHPDFCVFRKDRLKDYQEHLRQHYIFPEEWELLKDINQEENGGGMNTLFESCKTSDLLFDNWILKKISDTNKEQRKSLVHALTELTLPMIESDTKLKEKELAEDVSEQFCQFEKVFQDYTDVLDQKERKEQFLAGVLLYTHQCRQQSEAAQKQSQRVQENCRCVEQRITQEELSEKYHRLVIGHQEKTEQAASLESQLSVCKQEAKQLLLERRLMQAAQYKCAKIKAQWELETARHQLQTLERGDEAERLQNLGYTLRVRYEQTAQKEHQQYDELTRRQEEVHHQREELKEVKKHLSVQKEDLIRQQTMIEEWLNRYQEELPEFEERIGELPETDMFGDLIPESTQQIQTALTHNLTEADKLTEDIQRQIEETSQQIKDNQETYEQLNNQLTEQKISLSRLYAQRDDYGEKCSKITDILGQYDIDPKFLFEKEENLLRMNEHSTKVKTELDNAKNALAMTEDKLDRFEKNCLHTATRFVSLLKDNGISFQTGEAYLKQQNKAFQQKLLASDPLLPYCYLVDDANYEKLLTIPDDLFVDKLCPVILRRDIDSIAAKDEHCVELNQMRIYSMYDAESLDPDTAEHYGQKLIQACHRLKADIDSRGHSLDSINRDIYDVTGFDLTKQALNDLNNDISSANKTISALQTDIQTLKSDAEHLQEQSNSLYHALSDANNQKQQSQDRLSAFETFLNRARSAVKHRQQHSELSEKLKSVKWELKRLDDDDNRMEKEYFKLRERQNDTDWRCKDAQRQMAQYAQYSDGKELSGDMPQLEMEYEPLYRQQRHDRQKLDEQCEKAQKAISDNEEMLTKQFNDLNDADIPNEYDTIGLEKIREQEDSAKAAVTSLQSDIKSAKASAAQMAGDIEHTKRELLRKGLSEPLPPQQIKGNYEHRREQNDNDNKAAQQAEIDARKKCEQLSSRINQLEKLVDTQLMEDGDITPICQETNLSDERRELEALKKNVDRHFKNAKNTYEALCAGYADADSWIKETISFIDFDECHTYLSCYHSYELLAEKGAMLKEQIKLLKTELENIENNRSHIIHQIYEHGEFLVKQVRDISDHSYVAIQNKRRKIVEINIPDALDPQAEQRIADLVDKVTLKLRETLLPDTEMENKLYEGICSYYTDRDIFNAYTNLQHIRIRVLKVLQDERNSRLESWESRYSGGEGFLKYFIAYSALADYTRRRHTPGNKDGIRSVFLFDNPFGGASSDHVVKALIAITQKFNIQLICLSDLKQSSITNRFDLIYQLSMRRYLYSNKSGLQIDELVNHVDASRNSRLEYTFLKSQMTWLD